MVFINKYLQYHVMEQEQLKEKILECAYANPDLNFIEILDILNIKENELDDNTLQDIEYELTK